MGSLGVNMSDLENHFLRMSLDQIHWRQSRKLEGPKAFCPCVCVYLCVCLFLVLFILSLWLTPEHSGSCKLKAKQLPSPGSRHLLRGCVLGSQ